MTRPYEPLGMTTTKWQEIPPQPVKLSELKFAQRHLYIDGLLKALQGDTSYCGDKYPHVVQYQGEMWVDDGHHRATVAIIQGQAEIEARVLVV